MFTRVNVYAAKAKYHVRSLLPTTIITNIPTVTFSNGHKMSMLSFGTARSKNKDAARAVKEAIDLGYRYIDTALFYDNEKKNGETIREKIEDGSITRKNLSTIKSTIKSIYHKSKLWNNCHKEKLVVPACRKSLTNFGLEYLDLLEISIKKRKRRYFILKY